MKLKKFFNSKWILIIVLGILTSQYIRDHSTGRETFFLWKWWKNDLEYAKYIQVETYLLTDDQLKSFILNPEQQIIQPLWSELNAKLLTRVIRIKNTGSRKAWGKLLLNGRDGILLPVDLTRIEKNSTYKNSYLFIFQKGTEFKLERESPPPSFKVSWEELYTSSVN